MWDSCTKVQVKKLENLIIRLGSFLVFLSSCSSIKDSIVGSWRESSKPNSCVVFSKDGRFTSKSSKFKDDFVLVGSYSFSTDKEMKMTFDHDFFGVKEIDTTVVLNGSNGVSI